MDNDQTLREFLRESPHEERGLFLLPDDTAQRVLDEAEAAGDCPAFVGINLPTERVCFGLTRDAKDPMVFALTKLHSFAYQQGYGGRMVKLRGPKVPPNREVREIPGVGDVEWEKDGDVEIAKSSAMSQRGNVMGFSLCSFLHGQSRYLLAIVTRV
jgi:hypothetical protein